uniref:Uncharacterized protein n=1 Tax=Salix viminalis TaxID=40686 RepID=A0A6N2LVS0_SALVM
MFGLQNELSIWRPLLPSQALQLVPPSKPCRLQGESSASNAPRLQRGSFWFLPAALGSWHTSGVFQAEGNS